jgi:hypothetical protein
MAAGSKILETAVQLDKRKTGVVCAAGRHEDNIVRMLADTGRISVR